MMVVKTNVTMTPTTPTMIMTGSKVTVILGQMLMMTGIFEMMLRKTVMLREW